MYRLLKTFVLLACLLALLGYQYYCFAYYPLVPTQAKTLSLDIPLGMSHRAVIKTLYATPGVRHPPGFFSAIYLRLFSTRIQAGEYALSPGITLKQLMEKMQQGDMIQHAFTIVEGWNTFQLLEKLSTRADLSHHIVRSKQEIRAMEGSFFPDTYYFLKGTSESCFLSRALGALNKKLSQEWLQRDPAIRLNSAYEALILASIIEKETALRSEKARISGVFHARLQGNMPLQADPTVSYGLMPDIAGQLTKTQLRQDTPYNTYVHKGLPPTPIALPGLDSIRAALHPEKTGDLYFVVKGDGSHVFSKNLADHNKAVLQYRSQNAKY